MAGNNSYITLNPRADFYRRPKGKSQNFLPQPPNPNPQKIGSIFRPSFFAQFVGKIIRVIGLVPVFTADNKAGTVQKWTVPNG